MQDEELVRAALAAAEEASELDVPVGAVVFDSDGRELAIRLLMPRCLPYERQRGCTVMVGVWKGASSL